MKKLLLFISVMFYFITTILGIETKLDAGADGTNILGEISGRYKLSGLINEIRIDLDYISTKSKDIIQNTYSGGVYTSIKGIKYIPSNFKFGIGYVQSKVKDSDYSINVLSPNLGYETNWKKVNIDVTAFFYSDGITFLPDIFLKYKIFTFGLKGMLNIISTENYSSLKIVPSIGIRLGF